jgi:hypothetical protein
MKLPFLSACFAVMLGLMGNLTPASAQSQEQFIKAFSGKWQTLDTSYSNGSLCSVDLLSTKQGAEYEISIQGCEGDITEIASWGIVENQLAMLDDAGAIRIRLGGNQNRMTGQTISGRAVIFERAGTAMSAVSAAAISDGACLYLGYTATCAEAGDLADLTPPPGGGLLTAQVLVNLNARAEARSDAPVVAVVQENTCVVVEQCLQASDGRWCKARLQNASAWIKQQVIRANRWPVLTFKGSCEPLAGG